MWAWIASSESSSAPSLAPTPACVQQWMMWFMSTYKLSTGSPRSQLPSRGRLWMERAMMGYFFLSNANSPGTPCVMLGVHYWGGWEARGSTRGGEFDRSTRHSKAGGMRGERIHR